VLRSTFSEVRVRQSRRFCIGVNDAHLSFFAKRFGEMLPSSPVESAPLPTAEELNELALRNEGEDEDDLLSATVGGGVLRRR
jgi:hypothetical protein